MLEPYRHEIVGIFVSAELGLRNPICGVELARLCPRFEAKIVILEDTDVLVQVDVHFLLAPKIENMLHRSAEYTFIHGLHYESRNFPFVSQMLES